MKKIKILLILGLMLLIILIGLFCIDKNTTYMNKLSRNDTFDRFITLVEKRRV